MATNKLSDNKVKAARPEGSKPIKLADGEGLYLFVTVAGTKSWRFRYRRDGKPQTLVFGQYPAMSLADARALRDDTRRKMAQGIDPVAAKMSRQAETSAQSSTFKAVSLDWYERVKPTLSAVHIERIRRRLEVDVWPWIGDIPVGQIEPVHVLQVIRRIEARGVIETAHRALTNIGQVMRFAVASCLAKSDPTRDLRGALTPVTPTHYAAVTERAQVAEILKALKAYRGSPVVRAALMFGPLTFVRPGELRKAKWADINEAEATWSFVMSKVRESHIVPLSRQALAILAELRPLTGDGTWVFPSSRGNGRPMSENTVLVALRTCGIGQDVMSGHGWRAVARTMLDEILEYPVHLIEHQLGHTVRDPLGRAYNRTTHLKQRREMMQRWADFLDELAGG